MRRLLRNLWLLISAPFRGLAWLWRRLAASLRAFFVEEPEDTPLGDTVQKAIQNPADVLSHLAALRGHIVRPVLAMLVVAGLAFNYATPILDWLAAPIGGIQELQAVDVTEPIGVVMRVSVLVAFTLTLPYTVFELLLFAAPGLKRRARILVLLAIPLVLLLFLAGLLFTYYVILPEAVPFLLGFMDIPTLVRPSSYFSFSIALMFWIGIAFELPLVAYVLAAIGLLPARLLRQNWRIATVVLAVFAAAITPTVDPINMLLVLIPLLLLYLLSILTASIGEGQRLARQRRNA